jgi:FdhE protein
MHRSSTDIWHTDIQPRLDAVAIRNPEWRPWLALLEETLRQLQRPEWAALAPQPEPDRAARAPLLAEVTLTVDRSLARAWVRWLLQCTINIMGLSTPSLSMLNTRHLDALALLEAAICQDEIRLAHLSQGRGVDSGALGALTQLAALPLLQACGRHMELHVPAGWDEGYCPICGAWPTLTEVQGLERAHRWRCGRCGSGWGLAILRCPYCGEANHQRLGSLTAEDGEARCSVDTCLTCGGYIKTRTTLQATPAYAVILEDLATVDWDLVALEHGYMRPTHTGYPLRVRLVAPPSRIRAFFGRRP